MSKFIANKYSTLGSDEGEFEPGSRNKVLKNLLEIKTKKDMDNAEWTALNQAQDVIIQQFTQFHRFRTKDILNMHKSWLKKIYRFAGNFRTVNLSKGGFPFAGAKFIPNLMKKFEENILQKYTPCNFKDMNKVIEAIAIVHAEFILIHPFREGNGRLGRLLASLMAMQANLPMLNFDYIAGKHKSDYIAAVQAALNENYEPMKEIFKIVITKSIKKLSGQK